MFFIRIFVLKKESLLTPLIIILLRDPTHTKGSNMGGPPLRQIVQWILKAWSDLDKEIIMKSFRCCALSIQDHGSKDNEIACFKPGKPLTSDLERLKAAMAEATKELVDPFTESDIENDQDLVIDSDREEDEDVDTEETLKKQQHYHVCILSHSFYL